MTDRTDIRPAFALTVTDVLPDEMIRERLDSIDRMSKDLRHMTFVNIRCDSIDPERFASVARIAGEYDFGISLEANDKSSLLSASRSIPDKKPVLIMDPDTFTVGIRDIGLPYVISSRTTEGLVSLSEQLGNDSEDNRAYELRPFGMHEVLESMTRLSRMRLGPAMYRGNSGEYALTCSTVAVMRGASLIVLDDMDIDSCRILDDIMTNFGDPFRCA